MSFWEDLLPTIKGYLGIAAALIVLMLIYRSCVSGGDEAKSAPSNRGYQGAAP